MTHLRIFVAVLFACVAAWGCHDDHCHALVQPSYVIVGSGRVVTESRPVSGFSGVSVSLPARVVIVQSGEESLTVTAEDNILPLVRTVVAGGRLTLSLESRPSVSVTREIVIQVSARMVSAIDAAGATHVELTGLETDVFWLHVSGASEVTCAGAAREVRLDLSGAVRTQLDRLASRYAVASVSGTSYARLRVADLLEATASGLSVVEYYGDPVVVANVSGTSAVRRVGS